MNVKTGLFCYSMILGLVFLSFSKSYSNDNIMETQLEEMVDGASIYQKNHDQFKYYIETIGMVTIDKVELNEQRLTAIYSYRQGSEVRHVVSELTQTHDGIYKGACTTKVNGQVLFAVNTWLTFRPDGSAIGNWSWSGAPSKNDPIVEITKK